MSDKFPRCKVTLKRGKKRAWSIIVNDSSPECLDSLKKISGDLGKHGNKYLSQRIETSDPAAAKVLKDLNLM